MSNPNIGKEARKGGIARVSKLTKREHRELSLKMNAIRWARQKMLDKKAKTGDIES